MAGIKGKSGRQSKEIERATYKDLYSLFYGKINLKKLNKRIESGKYSARDYFQYELLNGVGKESRQTVIKKLYPDSVISDINIAADFEGIKLDI